MTEIVKKPHHAVKPHPDQERVKFVFDYRSDGFLIWKPRPRSDFATNVAYGTFKGRILGKVAGCQGPFGYWVINVRSGPMENTVQYKAHRLIWIWHYGDIPAGMELDHINGIRNDNRIENIRLVTKSENQKNLALSSRNTSGYMGVSQLADTGRWKAAMQVDKRRIVVGYFATKLEAAKAIERERKKYNYTERHGKPSTHHQA